MMNSEPKVYLDACCFIDMAAQKIVSGAKPERDSHVFYCRKFLEAGRQKEANTYTSTLTVAECIKVKDESNPSNHVSILTVDVKGLFESMLMSAKGGVTPVQPTPRIVRLARDLSWRHGARFTPLDSLHMATALEMKCSHFITTDAKLGTENIRIVNSMGLIVCTADAAAHLLPSNYGQLDLGSRIRPVQTQPAASGWQA